MTRPRRPPRRMTAICAELPPRAEVSRMMPRHFRSIQLSRGRVTPLFSPPTPRRPLPRCQGSETCPRASCGLTGVAQHADPNFAFGCHHKSRSRRASSTTMTKTEADCLRLFPDRRLGSFHRLRDLHHRCPRFRVGLKLPQIIFSPRIANGSILFRHGFHSFLEGIDVAIIAARAKRLD